MDMRPAEIAAELYQTLEFPRTFTEDMELHLLNGVVLSGPRWFIMFRPVDVAAHRCLIVNPAITFARHNGWHVHLCAGEWREALEMWAMSMPVAELLPWITWERCDQQLRYYATLKLLAKAEVVPYSSNHGRKQLKQQRQQGQAS